MCNRINQYVTPSQLQEFFDVLRAPEYQPRYLVNPTDPLLFLVDGDQGREGRIGSWGFSTRWSPTEVVFNSRAGEIFKTPMWKKVILEQRCLVPVASYYEYQDIGRRRKPRWHIRLRSNEPMGLAGVFNDRGEVSVLTTEPNAEQGKIHDRMPVILPPGDWRGYLDPTKHVADAILPFLRTAPDGSLVLQAVKPSNKDWPVDSPHWIEPCGPPVIERQRTLFDSEA
ncbi:MAG TPA: SOS response-associated peptidase [Planctomycetaceae bacterium]|nr:SOS response-associated peptidase [Planctomycetaceae bacterium]